MTARNTALLEATMRHIIDNPEQHDQRIVVEDCETAACFAGRACLLMGWRLWIGHGYGDVVTVRRHGVERPALDLATELLGLTEDEAGQLFAWQNTPAVLELIVKDLVNGERLRSDYQGVMV